MLTVIATPDVGHHLCSARRMTAVWQIGYNLANYHDLEEAKADAEGIEGEVRHSQGESLRIPRLQRILGRLFAGGLGTGSGPADQELEQLQGRALDRPCWKGGREQNGQPGRI